MTRRPTAYVEEYERLVRSAPKQAGESALGYVRRIAALAGDEQEDPTTTERQPGEDDE